MKKELRFIGLSSLLCLVLSGCGGSSSTDNTLQAIEQDKKSLIKPTSTISIDTFDTKYILLKSIPSDSNSQLGDENGVLYFIDPIDERGKSRVIRVDINSMQSSEIDIDGIAYSINRAGDSMRFYISTNDKNSFKVVSFSDNSVKNVSLKDKAHDIQAVNLKYNIQLLAAKDKPLLNIIDIAHDEVVSTIQAGGDTDSSQITSNGGTYPATAEAFWLDLDHFGFIDRVNRAIFVYKVTSIEHGVIKVDKTSEIYAATAFSTLIKVTYPKNSDDLNTFYALGEGDNTKGFSPYILELKFDPKSGTLKRSGRAVWLSEGESEVDGVKRRTYRAKSTPDGKYLIAPLFNKKVFIIDRDTMETVKVLDAELGAGDVTISKNLNLAVITNYYSTYITIIDLDTLSVKKELKISKEPIGLRSNNNSYVSSDGRYFFIFDNHEDNLLKIDLKNFQVDKTRI